MKTQEWNPASLRLTATRMEDGGWQARSVLECGGKRSATPLWNAHIRGADAGIAQSDHHLCRQQRHRLLAEHRQLHVAAKFQSAGGAWTTSGYIITPANATNSITISPPTGNLFFRLLKN
jgi:hypothetical protein